MDTLSSSFYTLPLPWDTRVKMRILIDWGLALCQDLLIPNVYVTIIYVHTHTHSTTGMTTAAQLNVSAGVSSADRQPVAAKLTLEVPRRPVHRSSAPENTTALDRIEEGTT